MKRSEREGLIAAAGSNALSNNNGLNQESSSTDPFSFEQIPNFDARKGYRPCASPGVVLQSDPQRADASLWRDKAGNVVARLSSGEYRFSFLVQGAQGQVADSELESLEVHLFEVLEWWMLDGVDDLPTTDLSTIRTLKST